MAPSDRGSTDLRLIGVRPLNTVEQVELVMTGLHHATIADNAGFLRKPKPSGGALWVSTIAITPAESRKQGLGGGGGHRHQDLPRLTEQQILAAARSIPCQSTRHPCTIKDLRRARCIVTLAHTTMITVVGCALVLLLVAYLFHRQRVAATAAARSSPAGASWGEKQPSSPSERFEVSIPPLTGFVLEDADEIAYRPVRWNKHPVTMGISNMPFETWFQLDHKWVSI